MYNIVYVTNLPAFYKINLLNKIAERRKIFVIFLEDSNHQRNEDFYSGERKFEYITIGEFSAVRKTIKIITLISKIEYEQLIIGGWDCIYFWFFVFFSPKNKNGIVVESSIWESKATGIKKGIKRLLLSRISTAYVPGKSNEDLMKILGFKGKIIETKGVGIFNMQPQPIYSPKQEVTKFIYVGRLSHEKNLHFLIDTFNSLPHLHLSIIGFGPLENELKKNAKINITFYGAIENKELYKLYRQNDVFLLPSLSEPWGLVVEEALNNGLPVIVSNKVGCSTEIVEIDKNGLIFNLDEYDSLKKAVLRITNPKYYNMLRQNVCTMDFEKIAEEQINCYL